MAVVSCLQESQFMPWSNQASVLQSILQTIAGGVLLFMFRGLELETSAAEISIWFHLRNKKHETSVYFTAVMRWWRCLFHTFDDTQRATRKVKYLTCCCWVLHLHTVRDLGTVMPHHVMYITSVHVQLMNNILDKRTFCCGTLMSFRLLLWLVF